MINRFKPKSNEEEKSYQKINEQRLIMFDGELRSIYLVNKMWPKMLIQNDERNHIDMQEVVKLEDIVQLKLTQDIYR